MRGWGGGGRREGGSSGGSHVWAGSGLDLDHGSLWLSVEKPPL